MGLKDVVIERQSVPYNGIDIELHGLTANDIRMILTRNRMSVDLMFDVADRKGIKSAADLNEENLKEVAQTAIAELPILVSATIAQCAGDIELEYIAASLPIAVQFDCLRAISRLTFSDATNFGEFLGNVIAAAKKVRSVSTSKKITSGEPRDSAGTPQ